MSDTVICMTLFIMIMVCVWTYIDIDHMIPFIQEVAKSYSKAPDEVDSEVASSLKVNNRSLFIVQSAMIATYLVLGFQVPARLVLGAAGLGVGEKVFMLVFQIATEVVGYKKAKESKGTNDTELQPVKEIDEPASKAKETKGTSEDKTSPADTELQPVKEIDEPTGKVTDAIPVEATKESEGTSADSPKSATEKDESQSEDTKVEDKASSEGTHADEAKIEK